MRRDESGVKPSWKIHNDPPVNDKPPPTPPVASVNRKHTDSNRSDEVSSFRRLQISKSRGPPPSYVQPPSTTPPLPQPQTDDDTNKGGSTSKTLIQQVTKFINILETDKPVPKNGRTNAVPQLNCFMGRGGPSGGGRGGPNDPPPIIHHKKFRLPATTSSGSGGDSSKSTSANTKPTPTKLNTDKTANCDSNAKMSNVTTSSSSQSTSNSHFHQPQQQQQFFSLPPLSSSSQQLHKPTASTQAVTAPPTTITTSLIDAKYHQQRHNYDLNPFLLHTDDLNRRFSIDSLLKQRKKKSPHL